MPSENGLVPVRFIRGAGPYNVGDVAGFSAALALDLVKAKKSAVYVDAADDPGPQPGDPVEVRDSSESASDPSNGSGGQAADTSVVEIPEGWQTLHGKTRKSLASKIKGGAVSSLEEADVVIAAEITRRAASAATQP